MAVNVQSSAAEAPPEPGTPPVLSIENGTTGGTANSSSSGTMRPVTDTAGGTLYGKRRNGAQQNAPTIKLNPDAILTGSGVVVGANPVVLTQLDDDTRYDYDWVHSTDDGDSNVITTFFTTLAAGPTPIVNNLSALRTVGTAPMGNIYFNEPTSPANRNVIPFHDIENVWTFPEVGNYDAIDSDFIWDRSLALAYGPRSCNFLTVPSASPKGVQCTAHDGENSAATSSIQITVNDPNIVFAGQDTAVVSTAGNFTDAPAGAAQFTSIAAARSHLSGKTNARLLLRAGETHGRVEISETGGSNRRYYVGRFGTGARPIINGGTSGNCVSFNTGGGGSTNYEELIVDGLDLRGTYDPTLANPAHTSLDGVNFSAAGRNTHKTVWNCRITGIARGIRLEGTVAFSQAQRRFYMGNTKVESFLDYGVFSGDGGDWGLAGCSVKQPTGTINGFGKDATGQGPGPYWADHGPFRISRGYGCVVFSCCDFISFNSWSGNSGNRVFQPVIRWNTGNGEANPELVIDRFRGEGGQFTTFNSVENDTNGGPTSTKNPTWICVDRVFHILSDHPGNSPQIPTGGTTVRNAIFVVPNSRAGWSIGFRKFIDTGGTGPNGPGNLNRRQEVYSCAFIDLRTDALSGSRTLSNTNRPYDLGGIGAFTPNYLGNNIEYTPRMVDGGAPNSATNLDLTPRYTPKYDGERWEGAAVDTSRGYTDEVTASFKPLAGSNAIGAASGKVSILDMDGKVRSTERASVPGKTANDLGPYETTLAS